MDMAKQRTRKNDVVGFAGLCHSLHCDVDVTGTSWLGSFSLLSCLLLASLFCRIAAVGSSEVVRTFVFWPLFFVEDNIKCAAVNVTTHHPSGTGFPMRAEMSVTHLVFCKKLWVVFHLSFVWNIHRHKDNCKLPELVRFGYFHGACRVGYLQLNILVGDTGEYLGKIFGVKTDDEWCS